MRVLLAVADPDFAKSARLALRSESLIVEVVTAADDALQRAVEVPYAALVLDLALLGARGVEFVKRLRRNQVAAGILALTSDSAAPARIEALRSGADDCLVTPVVMSELVARVHALARRAARKAGDCLEVEDLVLHCGRQRAFRAGRALPLTEREFLALESLVRAHGQPVPAAELLRTLWHEEGAPQENFIAVLMMRLRKKVDSDFPTKLLRTLRGQGYAIGVGE